VLSRHAGQFAEEGTQKKLTYRRVSSLSFGLPLLTVESARRQSLSRVFGPRGLTKAAWCRNPAFGP
jgi:hypothetical protein